MTTAIDIAKTIFGYEPIDTQEDYDAQPDLPTTWSTSDKAGSLKPGDITRDKRSGRLRLYWEPVGDNYTSDEKEDLSGFYEIPCMGELEEWSFDSLALTPAEDSVEPDHPDSWLRLLGMI
ncbi:MAG: hypothetical protein O3A14_19010 [Cyanobacteria bacterium]|nr:hypothetical protein [Cyanobacteriota bacterium]